jgi:uncharacterized lipoprotein
MKIKPLCFFVISLFIYGCATPPIALNYSPSSLLTTSGNINIGNFKYQPFIKKQVEENEIRNTAAGYFKIEMPVATLISNALKLEFKFMGTKLDTKSNKELTGEIRNFLLDDLGFSVDVTLAVNYIFKVNDKPCFEKEFITQKNAAKFSNPTGLVSETIKNNIESLVQNSQFIACLNMP